MATLRQMTFLLFAGPVLLPAPSSSCAVRRSWHCAWVCRRGVVSMVRAFQDQCTGAKVLERRRPAGQAGWALGNAG